MKYRCKVCGAIAEIDVDSKNITIEYTPPELPEPSRTMRIGMNAAFSFPSHSDCEFTKAVDKINIDALEKVDEGFFHKGGVG